MYCSGTMRFFSSASPSVVETRHIIHDIPVASMQRLRERQAPICQTLT
jgi:hypothetical protein